MSYGRCFQSEIQDVNYLLKQVNERAEKLSQECVVMIHYVLNWHCSERQTIYKYLYPPRTTFSNNMPITDVKTWFGVNMTLEISSP